MYQTKLQYVAIAIRHELQALLANIPLSNKFHDTIRYTMLAQGKCIRAFLVVECAELCGVHIKDCISIATAIELIHTYSLIHDDLPAMDNADMRRKQLSCHKKFNEATAILTGNALLLLAFEVIITSKSLSDNTKFCLLNQLIQAIGYNGMLAGQLADITSMQCSKDDIIAIHGLKTGQLISFSCQVGGIISSTCNEIRNHIRQYGKNIGLAFQIRDDIQDNENIIEDKVNLANEVGVEKATAYLHVLCDNAMDALQIFAEKAIILRDFTTYLKDNVL